ncbi:gamma-glutamylcyclotransferase family protein [Planktotalea sp.]|uniref:gamma-glutamylcyclotransferase family protein n=1 Tax=Planktotalea sp. TaxID=2029877 RepID=UPI003D6C178B
MDQASNVTPRFFGYGSLVNTATHDYPEVRRTRVKGWARLWRHTALREFAFLTAVPDPMCEIQGLSAEVPLGDWTALDNREAGYDRIALSEHEGTAIYSIPHKASVAATHPILLSYLDVVVQGYLNEFGEAGAALFFATTHGWDAPILDDRRAPHYPRHQVLSARETQFVDQAIDALECKIILA